MRRATLCAVLSVIGPLCLAPSAVAAPPPNDARSTPIVVVPPATVSGSTAESTLEADEPGSCDALRGSLFYEFRAASAERIVVRLQAAGDLDAVVDVFLRTRSQLNRVACERTDSDGAAAAGFTPVAGQTYLIRVGQRANSAPGNFRLDVFTPEPPPRGPGPALPASGARGTLDALQHTRDAFSFRMRAGTPYRLNVAAQSCVELRIYPPGTRDFDRASPVRTATCTGYLLFTPRAGEGGLHSLVVDAQPRLAGAQRYQLRAGPASGDDVAPGTPLANLTDVRGSLRGGELDTTDLFRFTVERRSALDLSLRYSGTGSAALTLYDDRGHPRGEDEADLSRTITPGRYFVAVRTLDGGTGRYMLRRASRTITRTRIAVEGKRDARSTPGRPVRVTAAVSPDATGPVTFTIEHFDPLAGWLFFRQVRANASGGEASIAFTPPTEGRWRMSAMYEGTRTAAPSRSGQATLLAAPPAAPR